MQTQWPSKRRVAENLMRIDIFGLRKCGFFDDDYVEGWCIWCDQDGYEAGWLYAEVSLYEDDMFVDFAHSSSDYCPLPKWRPDYRIKLTRTRCNFGGVRYWFLCPACRRRVACLYKLIPDRDYLCRHCNNLTYQSRQESSYAGGQNLYKRIARYKEQISTLERRAKRKSYRGWMTKKQRRIYRLRRRLETCLDIARHNEAYEIARRNRIAGSMCEEISASCLDSRPADNSADEEPMTTEKSNNLEELKKEARIIQMQVNQNCAYGQA